MARSPTRSPHAPSTVLAWLYGRCRRSRHRSAHQMATRLGTCRGARPRKCWTRRGAWRRAPRGHHRKAGTGKVGTAIGEGHVGWTRGGPSSSIRRRPRRQMRRPPPTSSQKLAFAKSDWLISIVTSYRQTAACAAPAVRPAPRAAAKICRMCCPLTVASRLAGRQRSVAHCVPPAVSPSPGAGAQGARGQALFPGRHSR